MPRGRKKVEVELLEPEEEIPPTKPAMKMVDAEHTIKYKEPMAVPATEESEEESSLLWDDDEQKPVKVKKSLREKLQEKLRKGGITNTEGVYLRIDRFLNPDAVGNDGMNGDKEFCWRGPCTIEYITNDDYLDGTAKRHGAGNYWFTLRNQKTILAQWQYRIGGSPQVITQQADPMTGQTQTIYQTIPQQNGQTSIPLTDPVKQMKGTLELMQLMNEMNPQTQLLSELLKEKLLQKQEPTEQTLSPKATLLNAMAEHPDIVEAVGDKLLGSARDGHKPSITELLIKHGAELAKGLGSMLTDVIRTAASEVKQIKQLDAHLIAQTQGGQNGSNQAQTENAMPMPEMQAPQATSQNLSPSTTAQSDTIIADPKDVLIKIALDGCEQNIPAKVIAQQLYSFAERVEEEAPHMSVYGWIDLFAENEPEQIIEFMKSGIIGERAIAVASLPDSHRWVVSLRAALSENQEGDEV